MKEILLGVAAFAVLAAATPASAHAYAYPTWHDGNVAALRTHAQAPRAYARVNPRAQVTVPVMHGNTDPDARIRDYMRHDPPDRSN